MSEIVSIAQANQFISGHSAYECGFFAVGMCMSMAPLGQPPKKTPGQILQFAEAAYAQYNGSNLASNTDGMSLEQLYSLLRQVNIPYKPVAMNDGAIASAISQGFPVVASVPETSVFDIALGRNPYPWKAQGNHVIVLTGINSSLAWDVRDSANIAPPNSLRPGPRAYDRRKLQYVSTTAIGAAHVFQVPQGWHDDGKTLTAPNGVSVAMGFRDYVCNHSWNPDNYPIRSQVHLSPLEQSNPGLGAGDQQAFRWIVLEWPDNEHKVIEMWTGQELVALQLSVANLKAQFAECQSKLMDCQAAQATAAIPVVTPPDYSKVKDFLGAQVTAIQAFEATL